MTEYNVFQFCSYGMETAEHLPVSVRYLINKRFNVFERTFVMTEVFKGVDLMDGILGGGYICGFKTRMKKERNKITEGYFCTF